MAASGVNSSKQMKRLESRKSHSWWWDSHIGPKNSRWLSANLEEMDRSVKRMLKLIEDDADSFAKKAEMYYKKRPQLISLVEEFYRSYRALAERYDHVTGELRKNVQTDLQSQGSGFSDTGSEPSSALPSPNVAHTKSGNRAAGFDFFLGSGGNASDINQKDGDESSSVTDSEEESDDSSSVNNYSAFSRNGSDPGMNRRISELENELREVKEKLWTQEGDHAEVSVSSSEARIENFEDAYAKINAYEHDLVIVNEKLRMSEEEITKLKIELENYRSLGSGNIDASVDKELEVQGSIDGVDKELFEPSNDTVALTDELRIAKENLKASEMQVASLKTEVNKSKERIQQLQEQLDLARKDISSWKTKFSAEKRESTKFQERLARLRSSLSDRDNEIRELKTAVSDAEEKIFPEKANLKLEMSKLLEEQTHLKELIREWECRGRSFEEEIRNIQSERIEMEAEFKDRIELLKAEIKQRENNKKELIAILDALKSERDNLNIVISSLKEDVNSRDGRIESLDQHLNELHMEHVQLISGMEETRRQVEEIKTKAKKLEEQVERQKSEILETAEEKREAIRQLCFSLEHYRNNYDMLKQQFIGHKRVPILAA
ncbi:protein NETWORKED 4A [Vicia villosa]|uniref:protein NETWORKED 4A n=1 Tax=Vicia villosa TaxID=3911 RepID=UPI00273C6EF4|nr:protein NETWORKED 4A [Vicia villosa]XP_058747996.1 protein NETWORKED 4A [Vicia villosa]XP_058747997.1 protein NETWORKED 4A [Vicia villosa]